MEVMGKKFKENGALLILGVAIFAFIFIFFTRVHPIVIFDEDDWSSVSFFRNALPAWGKWNPTRVFPEVLVPLLGYFSAYVTRLLVPDYLAAFTVTAALALAVCVVAFYGFFLHYLRSGWKLSTGSFVALGILWLALYFGLFKSQKFNNVYMFYATNFTCFFNYVVPGIFNCLLVFTLAVQDDVDAHYQALSYGQKGLFLVIFYLALFSHLFSSCILAIYCFSRLVLGWLQKQDRSLAQVKAVLAQHRVYAYTVFFWLICLILETSGGNASTLEAGAGSFYLPLGKTLAQFGLLVGQLNKGWLALILVTLVAAGIIYGKSKEVTPLEAKYKGESLVLWLSTVLTLVFLILICAKAGPGYANRMQSMYGFFFYLTMVFFVSGAYILAKVPKVAMLLPILTLIMAVSVTNSNQHYLEATIGNHAPKACLAVDEDIIRQVQAAEQRQQKHLVLKVPKGDNKDNWPHPFYMGRNISRTLLAHGIISHDIKIKIQPDPEMNRKYYR